MLKITGPLSFVLVGLLIAGFIYSLFLNFNSYYEEYFPKASVFEATLLVPDFKTGENTVVQYTREIRATFRGTYYVEVKNAVTGETACRGTGSSIYTPDDELSPPIYFDWYVNDNCIFTLKPDQYFVETTYVIQEQDVPNKNNFYTTHSNIFNVTP